MLWIQGCVKYAAQGGLYKHSSPSPPPPSAASPTELQSLLFFEPLTNTGLSWGSREGVGVKVLYHKYGKGCQCTFNTISIFFCLPVLMKAAFIWDYCWHWRPDLWPGDRIKLMAHLCIIAVFWTPSQELSVRQSSQIHSTSPGSLSSLTTLDHIHKADRCRWEDILWP